jgi:hypothetical protein
VVASERRASNIFESSTRPGRTAGDLAPPEGRKRRVARGVVQVRNDAQHLGVLGLQGRNGVRV